MLSENLLECNYHQIGNENGANMIWGEMPPECIPSIDGYRIISLYRKGISRSFGVGFLTVGHSALTPYVKIIKELSDDEYNQWEAKIKENTK